MLSVPQYQQLQMQYQEALIRIAEQDSVIAELKEANRQLLHQNALLADQLSVLQGAFEQLQQLVTTFRADNARLQKSIEEKDKQLEKQALVAHELEQLKRSIFGRTIERLSSATPAPAAYPGH